MVPARWMRRLTHNVHRATTFRALYSVTSATLLGYRDSPHRCGISLFLGQSKVE
jgi:hypothetical protein